MARPRSFNETAALDAAAAEFRVHGFAHTSTEQLCKATGIQRSSLYNTFISKEELYMRALARYIEITSLTQESILANTERSGAARLEALMATVLNEEREASMQGHAAGCMVVGARMTPDLREANAEITPLLDRALSRQLELLRQAIQIGQLDGSLRSDMPTLDAARMVITLISGIRVLAQTGTTMEELQRVVTLSLDSLRP